MSKGKVTIEAEIMDRQHGREGMAENLAWDSFSSQLDPSQIASLNDDLDACPPELVRASERVDTMRALLSHVLRDFKKHSSAEDVGKRVIAIGKFMGHRELDEFSLKDIGDACGETKATVSARIRREVNDPIEKSGGVAQARFQQTPEQRAKSAKVQKGNTNRREGKKS